MNENSGSRQGRPGRDALPAAGDHRRSQRGMAVFRRLFGVRPSPALLVASVALLLAMGGTGVAASGLSVASVGSAQLRTGAVTGPKIAADAVTSAKVKNGSLSRADFAAGQIPSGPPGPAGPAGQNALADATVISHSHVVSDNDYYWYWSACPSGKRALGGGANTNSDNAYVNESFPVDANGNAAVDGAVAAGWRTEVSNLSGGALTVTVYVVCA